MTGDRGTIQRNAKNAAYSYERIPQGRPTPEESSAKLRAWRDSAYLSRSMFRNRLDFSGITEETFSALLDGAVTFSALPEATDWANELTEVLRCSGADHYGLSTRLYGYDFPRLPFEALLGSFLTYYEQRLRDRLGHSQSSLWRFEERLRERLLAALANRLLKISARTLILELNVARVDGKLRGDSPEHRYSFYAQGLLADDGYLAGLFAEYPVLGRSMVECARRWVVHVSEVLSRLVTDATELRAQGLIGPDARSLVDIDLDLGDNHEQGRSVAMLTFDDGGRLIYKPRSVATEALYSALSAAVNDYGPRHRSGNISVVEGDGYGWCEFIEYRPCESPEDVGAFYWRIGGSLANLLYLGAIDFHMENVIAAGACPMLVDMETIFQHPPLYGHGDTAHQKAMSRLFGGVLATGILPARVFGDRRAGGVDLSAINGGVAQETSRPVPTMVDSYTDVMRIEARTATLGKAKNRPFCHGTEVRPEDYIEEVISGFEEVYDIIAQNQHVFRAMLDAATGIEIRHLPRQTRRYSLFLTESSHPDYLRNALDRERLLDKLWAAAETRPDLVPIIEFEKRQLMHGDIPCFRTNSGSTDLHAPGCGTVHDYFTEPSIAAMGKRLAGFSPEHRETQVRIIRETMSTLLVGEGRKGRKLDQDAPPYAAQDAAAAARQLATRLADQAILGADDCSWLGVTLDGGQEDSLTYKPVGTALYDGLAGLAVVFARAAELFADDRYLDIARRCAVPVVAHLKDAAKDTSHELAGAFDGIAGLLYALHHMGSVTGDLVYRAHIEESASLLLRVVKDETSPDVINGLAGSAIVALGLERRYANSAFREAAEVCAQRLQEMSVDLDGAAGWKPAPKSAPMGGLSHGSAGIAWALFELAAGLGVPELEELGWKAVEFDRRLFVPEEGRWRDLRQEQGIVSRPLKPAGWWCNGGAGIGLSRLLIAGRRADTGVLAEAEAALHAVYEGGFGENHSLCHGDFGNIELFTLAGELLPDRARAHHWSRMGARAAHGILSDLQDSGPMCGIPAGRVDVPGMMIGTAGICLGLMRLAAPERVPSVLSLQFDPR
ncbi:type 2 lanthipeptide synthetase LanM family protein [Streptomyces violaceusniger]|uniref:Lanthionine synthetase C family protein n=1 Tax=Streptomyces violaceusniger (strain Tu 4113) TaxID=653045 RepID=G2P7E2_STRV4|nr:type 2 lanthipeptide synthetase LanM family protein [Streptomyces violaceusniger]AEM87102.1 Lanthionine synthetase C family protein [Streptomyces violaceusniger Tu 4113]